MKFPTTWFARARHWVVWIAAAFCLSTSAATNEPMSPAALKKLSLEELLDQQVTLVTRKPEKLTQSPSPVQVLTGEDIRRSGATSIAEALRLAPNLQVAQASSWQWAISGRGFNQPGLLANKLLVMIDGRTVYTPLFAGVFWEVQNTLLEDLDRIEVVTGPGAALWGANAVNGVINIVTKGAKNTQGLFVEGGGGSLLQDFAAVRYGGSSGTNLFYRVYGQRFDRNSTVFSNGTEAGNAWDMTQGGFRIDYEPAREHAFTLQGDAYSGSIEQAANRDTVVDGQNVLARWTRTFSEESDLTVQAYFDRTWRRIPDTFDEDLKTYDVDFQHRFPLGTRQSIIWGGGYRLMEDEVGNSAGLAFLPPRRNLQLFNGFVQDEITLLPEQLKLHLGTKLEHNDYSGFELQPSVRLAWMPTSRQTVWAAISRAVRSPSRIDRDFYVPAAVPLPLAGGTNFNSETVVAYEIGYRVQPHDRLSLSIAAFYNDYDNIRSVETNGATIMVENGLRAQSWGMEFSGEFRLREWWRLRGGYTYMHKDVWQKPGSIDVNRGLSEGNDPEHQVVLQSILNLPAGFQFDLAGRYVDALPAPSVPGYFTFDARLAWQATRNLEFSLIGQNLWENRHPEFGAAPTRQEIPRSLFGKVTWRF
ncbi:MAG: TonB-dependent receptor [Akkermansiaceae bacterium]|nr:TonB-dependent receptor [Verrucomicrobiales bacterium]